MLGQVLHQFREDHEARDLVREHSLQKVTSASCSARGPGELQASESGVSNACSERQGDEPGSAREECGGESPNGDWPALPGLGVWDESRTKQRLCDEETQREVDRDSETGREIDQEIK